jgi:hypothetical protein
MLISKIIYFRIYLKIKIIVTVYFLLLLPAGTIVPASHINNLIFSQRFEQCLK